MESFFFSCVSHKILRVVFSVLKFIIFKVFSLFFFISFFFLPLSWFFFFFIDDFHSFVLYGKWGVIKIEPFLLHVTVKEWFIVWLMASHILVDICCVISMSFFHLLVFCSVFSIFTLSLFLKPITLEFRFNFQVHHFHNSQETTSI